MEKDALGAVEVPHDAYYGAQTARALANFPVSGIAISHFSQFLRAMALVKKAATRTNARLGRLPAQRALWMEVACDEIIAGKLDAQFAVDVFQGGAGTSTNMNFNEVIANRALVLMGRARGEYAEMHPNNDVNLSQSTNDVYPTAMRLGMLFSVSDLQTVLGRLAEAFERKGAEFADIPKLGRTQLQDAVPMTLGQEFGAFGATLREDIDRLGDCAAFLHEVNLGGTAIGTGIGTDPTYQAAVIVELAALSGLPLQRADNLMESSWDTGAYVLFSGMLKRTATKLSKICNDLRLLSSGPRGGLAEIQLPPMQPGSSIMPGKVNPVIPEMVNQVAFQVIGADVTVTLAAEAGQLQLNAMEPVILYNILHSISLMSKAADLLASRCVDGIVANPLACLRNLEASTAMATALSSLVGYDRASALALEVLQSGLTFRAVVESDDTLPPGLARSLFRPV